MSFRLVPKSRDVNKTFSSRARPRPRPSLFGQDQDQDFAPQDQDQDQDLYTMSDNLAKTAKNNAPE